MVRTGEKKGSLVDRDGRRRSSRMREDMVIDGEDREVYDIIYRDIYRDFFILRISQERSNMQRHINMA